MELATFVPDYRTYTYAQQYDLYTICCKDEYWTDSAIDGAMKRRRGVSIISSAACKALYNNGGTSAITQRVDFLLHGSTHVFIVFHLKGPPQHFTSMHITSDSAVYYDSLSGNKRGRINKEYEGLLDALGANVDAPKIEQKESECGAMVVQRYYELFHGEVYHETGKKVRNTCLNKYISMIH